MSDGARPALSIVIPVFNEAPSLVALHQRLARTLEKIGRRTRSSSWTTAAATTRRTSFARSAPATRPCG